MPRLIEMAGTGPAMTTAAPKSYSLEQRRERPGRYDQHSRLIGGVKTAYISIDNPSTKRFHRHSRHR
jgi:hypothetical protein